jgi:hypothetical protein
MHCSTCHDKHAVTVEAADRWRELAAKAYERTRVSALTYPAENCYGMTALRDCVSAVSGNIISRENNYARCAKRRLW